MVEVADDESGQIVPLRDFMAEPEGHALTYSGTVELEGAGAPRFKV